MRGERNDMIVLNTPDSCDNRPMSDPDDMPRAGERPSTRADEENLLLEVSEDRRLRRLGIDPDQDSLAIMLQLKKRMADIEAEKRNRPAK